MTSAPPTPPFQPNNGSVPQRPRFRPDVPNFTTPRSSKRHLKYGAGGLAIGLILGVGIVGGILGINSAVEASELQAKSDLVADVFEVCELEEVESAMLSDDQLSITMSAVGEYDGPDFTDLHCVGYGLDMPDSVTSRMSQTRALDGTQTAEWDSFTVSWNFHPDDGLGAVFEFVPPSD